MRDNKSHRPKPQIRRLREYFVANPDTWLSMAELVKACGSFVIHSRVADLRSEGMFIEHHTFHEDHDGESVAESCYRYLPETILTELGF